MRKALVGAAALLLMCGAARANEVDRNQGLTEGHPVIGVGLVCDTSEQAVRFVTLRASGAEPRRAMETVNAEAHQPLACGIAAVAFVPEHTLETKTMEGKLVRIVRIHVVAGFNGHGWQPVTGLVQYAVVEAAGESI